MQSYNSSPSSVKSIVSLAGKCDLEQLVRTGKFELQSSASACDPQTERPNTSFNVFSGPVHFANAIHVPYTYPYCATKESKIVFQTCSIHAWSYPSLTSI